MPEQEKDNECEAEKEVGDARVGYQAAVTLWAYEGNTFWSKFYAMLVANSIVIGSVALSNTVQNPSCVFVVGMPIFGIVLCILWLQLSERSLCNYDYWILAAREIEERFLSGSVDFVRRGGDYTKGKKVKLQVSDPDRQEMRMNWLGRRPRVRIAAYAVIGLFTAVYIAMLVVAVC